MFVRWTCEDCRKSYSLLKCQSSQHVLHSIGGKLHLRCISQTVKDVMGLFQLPWHWISTHNGGHNEFKLYIDVVEKNVIPDMSQASLCESGISQQDLASCNTPKIVTKLFKDNHII